MTVKICLMLCVAVLAACFRLPVSSDEVARVAAPSGVVEAVLVETNGGATTSFGYEVFVVSAGGRVGQGVQVAELYGAARNRNAYGVNLRWAGADQLAIEYLEAKAETLLVETATIAGHRIRVRLDPGVLDSLAPPGGMLYNLNSDAR